MSTNAHSGEEESPAETAVKALQGVCSICFIAGLIAVFFFWPVGLGLMLVPVVWGPAGLYLIHRYIG